jgi:hypothetical protein
VPLKDPVALKIYNAAQYLKNQEQRKANQRAYNTTKRDGTFTPLEHNPNFKDRTGERYGRWTVVSRGSNYKDGSARWNTVCTCGNEGLIKGTMLESGDSTSCGCYAAEQRLKAHTKHGMGSRASRHYLYITWDGVKQRCLNPNNPGYLDYGGRDIKIHPRWLKFTAFRDYVLRYLGERPEDMTLDRIDNDGDYRPGNVRWADHETQARNKRTSLQNRKRAA